MLFRLLPVPLCVMKVFMHVNGLQSHTAELSLVTHTNSQPGCGCVCVSGWVSLCLADGHGLTGRGWGRSSNKPFRTESEYTYYTAMLYEKCEFGKLHNINVF